MNDGSCIKSKRFSSIIIRCRPIVVPHRVPYLFKTTIKQIPKKQAHVLGQKSISLTTLCHHCLWMRYLISVASNVACHLQTLRIVLFFSLGETSTIGGCFVLWVCCSGSTRRLNRKEVLEARDRTCDPWFTRRVT